MLTRRDSYKQTDAKFALLGARNVGKSGKLIVLISYSVRYTAQKAARNSQSKPGADTLNLASDRSVTVFL